MDEEPQLEPVTEELYANPPAEFVARRDALAAQARAAGDRLLAKQIKALRRPSVGAWYLNASARAGLASLKDLTDLGQQLRDAQAAGDFAALRVLAARRNPVVGAVVRELAAELGRLGTSASPAGLDEVRNTLASALADPGVADQLTRGRLDRPHNYSGFGALSSTAAVTTLPPARSGRPAAAEDPAEAERIAREQAEQEVAAAEAELEAGIANRAVAEDRARAAGARVEALAAEFAEARDRLAEAEAGLAQAAEAERAAAGRVEQARSRLPPPALTPMVT
ncbi:MAG: hypothetical protein IT193_19035 [Propionibacteriaceae bacterium]|nr:hypothetical protein [Propionibacteriaceae bacterium]